MKMRWTENYISELKNKGRIRDYKVNKPREPQGKIAAKYFKRKSKEKDWLEWNIGLWCNEHAVQLQEEYQFHPERKWRADWFISALRTIIEYEGIFSDQSRHTNKIGYAKDAQKYNEAEKMGLTVIRLTAMDYKSVLRHLDEIWNNVKNKL